MRKVLGLIFLGLMIAGVGPVMAEDASAPKPPDYVPIVVDAAQYEAIRGYLNEMRFKDAAPVWNWLQELEGRAKGQWEADHAPKKDTGAKK